MEEPKVEELTEADIADFVFQMSQGKGRTPSVDALLAERELTYGSFSGQAQIAQELKYVAYNFARDRGTTLIATQNEALDMIFHKIARILNGNPDYVDNWIDIAGYAKLVADDLEKL
jgi:coproporphyrinogen III oxidase